MCIKWIVTNGSGSCLVRCRGSTAQVQLSQQTSGSVARRVLSLVYFIRHNLEILKGQLPNNI